MKNDKNKRNKPYKNKTKNKEAELINMSRNSGNDKEAERRLKILRICYSGISVFMRQDHNKIVDKLYFNSRYSIIDNSVVKMTDLVNLNERTMKRYRDKYCLVAEQVFSILDNTEL